MNEEKKKVYTYRQYPSVYKKLEKILKKKKIPVSGFVRAMQFTLVDKADKLFKENKNNEKL